MVTGDGGRSWRMTAQAAVQLSPASPTEAWAVDAGRSLAAGIPWHTTDAGASWEGVVRPGALPIDSLAGSPRWLVAHAATGAWSSTDAGRTWLPFVAGGCTWARSWALPARCWHDRRGTRDEPAGRVKPA